MGLKTPRPAAGRLETWSQEGTEGWHQESQEGGCFCLGRHEKGERSTPLNSGQTGRRTSWRQSRLAFFFCSDFSWLCKATDPAEALSFVPSTESRVDLLQKHPHGHTGENSWGSAWTIGSWVRWSCKMNPDLCFCHYYLQSQMAKFRLSLLLF